MGFDGDSIGIPQGFYRILPGFDGDSLGLYGVPPGFYREIPLGFYRIPLGVYRGSMGFHGDSTGILWRFYGCFIGHYRESMGILSDSTGIMGFCAVLLGFYGDSMGSHRIPTESAAQSRTVVSAVRRSSWF